MSRVNSGFKQTEKHKPGNLGHFPAGLVRGQFGAIPIADWLKEIAAIGYDGYEEASWELDLRCCDNDEGAEEFARELIEQAGSLTIFSVAAHLQGQALGDEPSAKTLQFVGGEALEAYKVWRAAGNIPPRTNPFFVPENVGVLIHSQAEADLLAVVRLAHFLGKLQDRRVPVTGFVGSPAERWKHWFGFPPLPKEIGGYEIPNVNEVSAELLIERFTPVFQALDAYDVYFGLECHPSEFAIGDISSATEFLDVVRTAGFETHVGFNLDASHMVWQGVNPIAFIRKFAKKIFSVHIKGVQVSKYPTENGLLGGHRPMGDPDNGWNFVTACSGRDSINEDEIITELRRIGYSGAINVEWEDNDADPIQGAELALDELECINLAPSTQAHDEALKAKE